MIEIIKKMDVMHFSIPKFNTDKTNLVQQKAACVHISDSDKVKKPMIFCH